MKGKEYLSANFISLVVYLTGKSMSEPHINDTALRE
jgi:hypothetical protein